MDRIIDNNNAQDPRIKSPDLILNRADKIAQLQAELRDLQQRYNSEIKEWKEYERNVCEWRDQVLVIIKNLKTASEKNH